MIARLTLLLAAIMGGMGCGPVEHPMSLAARGDAVFATGQIVAGNAGTLAGLVATNHPRTLILDSNGGEVGEAAAMADTIRLAGLAVAVPPRAMCASACFMLLAAGRDRSAAPNSSIGVHRAALNCGRDDSPFGTEVMASKAIAFGTPSGIVRRMVSTPQPGIAWLSAADLADLGVRVR